MFGRDDNPANHRHSLHQKEQQPPTSGPFQRIRPYSPEDYGASIASSHRDEYMSTPPQESHDTTYISPLTGHPDSSHQAIAPDSTDRDLLSSTPLPSPNNQGVFPNTYETAVSIPISRLNKDSPQNTQSHFTVNSGDPFSQPFVQGSEIDDFSRSWNNNITSPLYAQERDTHIHSGDMPETMDVGLAGAVRRAASNLTGNGRSVDSNARSEAMRHADAQNSAWNAHSLHASPVPENPPALKDQMMQAFNAATSRDYVTPVTPVRYQLVDDGPSGDDINVLEGPGIGRGLRPRKEE